MFADQICAIYKYLRENTDHQVLANHLNAINEAWNAEEAVLYLPMYSLRTLNRGAASRRIAWLRINEMDANALANANPNALSNRDIGDGALFGAPRGTSQLVNRAQSLVILGPHFLETLQPAQWSWEQLLRCLISLETFDGVGLAAALHILMDLGWAVVKPDLHIVRFLRRLGNPWRDFFYADKDQLYPAALIQFQEKWRDECATFARHEFPELPGNAQNLPEATALTPRQIDALIMLYTQKRSFNEAWRPDPVCTNEPRCRPCQVPNCGSRNGL